MTTAGNGPAPLGLRTNAAIGVAPSAPRNSDIWPVEPSGKPSSELPSAGRIPAPALDCAAGFGACAKPTPAAIAKARRVREDRSWYGAGQCWLRRIVLHSIESIRP